MRTRGIARILPVLLLAIPSLLCADDRPIGRPSGERPLYVSPRTVAWQADGLEIRASDLAKNPTILPKTERCADTTIH